ncbi:MAG TPA: hypothetical protein DCO89_02625 [Clostridiales bacterium]|nr:hypothetical protein [Clostridiales bacterium]
MGSSPTSPAKTSAKTLCFAFFIVCIRTRTQVRPLKFAYYFIRTNFAVLLANLQGGAYAVQRSLFTKNLPLATFFNVPTLPRLPKHSTITSVVVLFYFFIFGLKPKGSRSLTHPHNITLLLKKLVIKYNI